jgi:outer membrane immunogenic protein
MKQFKMTALAIALTSVTAGSAMAQSAKTNAWEGAYGQVGVGFGIFSPSISNGTAVAPAPYSAAQITTSASNVNNVNTGLVNLAAGYNFAINKEFLLGLGVTYYPGASSGATGTLVGTAAAPYGALSSSQTATYNVKNLYSVVLTPGYAIDKDRLAYAKIGYTGATIGLSTPTIANFTTNLNGLALGLGYKQIITGSIYGFGEVNYATYGSKNVATVVSTSGATYSGMSAKGNGLDFLVGVGYRF